MSDEDREIEIVYMGSRELRGGKFGSCVVPLDLIAGDPSKAEALSSVFGNRKMTGIVGGVYRVRGNLDADGRLTRVVPVLETAQGGFRRFENSEAVAAWEAEDKAARVAKQARSMEAKLKRDGKLARALAPLQDVYRSTSPMGRLALEVVVLSELRKGRA